MRSWIGFYNFRKTFSMGPPCFRNQVGLWTKEGCACRTDAPLLPSYRWGLPLPDHQLDWEATPADYARPWPLSDHATRSPGASTPDGSDRAVRTADPHPGPAERQPDHPRHVAAQRCRWWWWRRRWWRRRRWWWRRWRRWWRRWRRRW